MLCDMCVRVCVRVCAFVRVFDVSVFGVATHHWLPLLDSARVSLHVHMRVYLRASCVCLSVYVLARVYAFVSLSPPVGFVNSFN